MFCWLAACVSFGALAYVLQADFRRTNAINKIAVENGSECSPRRLSVDAKDFAEPAEVKERTRRRNALIGVVLVDAPILVFLISLIAIDSTVVVSPLVVLSAICAAVDALIAFVSALYATAMLRMLSLYKALASQLDETVEFDVFGAIGGRELARHDSGINEDGFLVAARSESENGTEMFTPTSMHF